MKSFLHTLASCCLAFTFASTSVQAQQAQPQFDSGMIASPHIVKPDGKVKANIFLLSDADGWNATEEAQGKALAAKGALVIGIDLPSYIASLDKDDEDCIYMISDIESLAQQVQRSLGSGSYRSPIVAGVGAGGAFVLGMLAQSPPATIGQAIAIDPDASIKLSKVLCTPADKQQTADGIAYGLTDGALPAPISVYFTSQASADSRQHVKDIQEKHDDLDVEDAEGSANDALIAALSDQLDASGTDDEPLGLPLTILEAKPKLDTMAIVFSGDGGWRDIDSEVGAVLQADGIPVVGVDALRYFWSKKTPEQTATDLSRIIRTYRKQWNVKNVMLVGYSFGADILPSTFNRLPEADRNKVSLISLLGLSHSAEFEISVTGWLGGQGSGDGGDPTVDLKQINPARVQCIYGTEDDEEACKGLAASGVEILGIEGGHHFDEDYEKLAQYILTALKARLAK
ncbi:AcvB/VirJ family lysyl-phosphatidylglycerol hydrolase [Allorhizobium pseudoryzae]|uniref:virulence factor family protein n=1 Tax=Allorhizobium pseudoryzae TaxID=379684 RepID=UPI003D0473F1